MKDELKDLVGGGAYRWDMDKKKWYVLDAYAQEVYDLFATNGYEVAIDDDLVGTQELASGDNPFQAIFGTIDDAGVKKKLFHAMSLILHPDIYPAGGGTLMKLLTDAYKE